MCTEFSSFENAEILSTSCHLQCYLLWFKNHNFYCHQLRRTNYDQPGASCCIEFIFNLLILSGSRILRSGSYLIKSKSIENNDYNGNKNVLTNKKSTIKYRNLSIISKYLIKSRQIYCSRLFALFHTHTHTHTRTQL